MALKDNLNEEILNLKNIILSQDFSTKKENTEAQDNLLSSSIELFKKYLNEEEIGESFSRFNTLVHNFITLGYAAKLSLSNSDSSLGSNAALNGLK